MNFENIYQSTRPRDRLQEFIDNSESMPTLREKQKRNIEINRVLHNIRYEGHVPLWKLSEHLKKYYPYLEAGPHKRLLRETILKLMKMEERIFSPTFRLREASGIHFIEQYYLTAALEPPRQLREDMSTDDSNPASMGHVSHIFNELSKKLDAISNSVGEIAKANGTAAPKTEAGAKDSGAPAAESDKEGQPAQDGKEQEEGDESANAGSEEESGDKSSAGGDGSEDESAGAEKEGDASAKTETPTGTPANTGEKTDTPAGGATNTETQQANGATNTKGQPAEKKSGGFLNGIGKGIGTVVGGVKKAVGNFKQGYNEGKTKAMSK